MWHSSLTVLSIEILILVTSSIMHSEIAGRLSSKQTLTYIGQILTSRCAGQSCLWTVIPSNSHCFGQSLLQTVTASDSHCFGQSLLRTVTASDSHCFEGIYSKTVASKED